MSSTIEMQGQFPYKSSMKQKVSLLLLFPIIIRLSTMPIQFIACIESDWHGILYCVLDFIAWWCIALIFTLCCTSPQKEQQYSSIVFTGNQDALEIASSFYKIAIKWDCILRASYNPSTHLLRIRFSDTDNPKKEITITAYIQDKTEVINLSRMIHDYANTYIFEE